MLSRQIDAWLRAFAKGHGELHRDDVHIDRLNGAFRHPSRWIEGSLECLALASHAVERHSWSVTVAIEFFLKPGRVYEQAALRKLDELSDRWSYTPPALTVYRSGSEPWTKSTAFRRLDVDIGPNYPTLRVQAYWQEWHDEAEDEYDKRMWLTAIK